jgi:hypothetical protein
MIGVIGIAIYMLGAVWFIVINEWWDQYPADDYE